MDEKTFFINDFSSQNFLSDNIFIKSPALSDCQYLNSPESLLDLIDQTNSTFNTIKQQIDNLQEKFIRHLTGMYAVPNDQSIEELETLKLMLEKCHKRVLQEDLDPLMIDELAILLKRYEKLAKRKKLIPSRERISETLRILLLMKNNFHLTLAKCDDIASWKSWRSLALNLENPSQKIHSYSRQKVFQLPTNQKPWPEGTVLSIRSQKYFGFVVEDRSHLQTRNSFRILDISSGRLLSSVANFGDASRNLVNETFDNQVLYYISSLNMIVVLFDNDHTYSDIILYKIGSRNMKKVVQIPLKSFMLDIRQDQRVNFEVLDPQHIFAITLSFSVLFVNILTRKILYRHNFGQEIYDVRYIEDTKLLAVALHDRLLVYDVSSHLTLSHLKSCIQLELPNRSLTTNLAANVFLVFYHQDQRLRDVHGRIYEDNSATTFHIFQLDHDGTKEYKVVLKDQDVHEQNNNFIVNDARPTVGVQNVIIQPDLKKLIVLLDPEFQQNQLNDIILDFGVGVNHTAKIEEDALIYDVGPSAYFFNQDLIVWKKDNEVVKLNDNSPHESRRSQSTITEDEIFRINSDEE